MEHRLTRSRLPNDEDMVTPRKKIKTAPIKTECEVTTDTEAEDEPGPHGPRGHPPGPGSGPAADGRGSYRCGRCGALMRGYVGPYQPRVRRRPEDPVPEMKCVSTQVEMDKVS